MRSRQHKVVSGDERLADSPAEGPRPWADDFHYVDDVALRDVGVWEDLLERLPHNAIADVVAQESDKLEAKRQQLWHRNFVAALWVHKACALSNCNATHVPHTHRRVAISGESLSHGLRPDTSDGQQADEQIPLL